MKKISTFALLITLGLAAPALAQTPADVRNGRHLAMRDAMKVEMKDAGKPADATETKGKKSKKHTKKKHKKSKKHETKVEVKKEEAKKEEVKKEDAKKEMKK